MQVEKRQNVAMTVDVQTLVRRIDALSPIKIFGRVVGVQGLLIEVVGIENHLSVGGRCHVVARGNRRVLCEIVGFRDGKGLMLPFAALEGVGLGCKVELADAQPTVMPSPAWLGRVINALGEPIDGKGTLPSGDIARLVRAAPPPAHMRQRVGGKLDLGVRSVNAFTTLCQGQRMGVFAGSGVGKSSLMSMAAPWIERSLAMV